MASAKIGGIPRLLCVIIGSLVWFEDVSRDVNHHTFIFHRWLVCSFLLHVFFKRFGCYGVWCVLPQLSLLCRRFAIWPLPDGWYVHLLVPLFFFWITGQIDCFLIVFSNHINLEQPFWITLYHDDCSDELAGGMVSREPIDLERHMMEQIGSVVGDLFSTK